MNTTQLIEALQQAKYWEDEFILKYDSESFWELLKTLPKSKFDKIKELLDENLKDTRHHKAAIESLIKNIQEGKYEL